MIETFCGVYEAIKAYCDHGEPFPRQGFVNGIKPKTWFCPHGCISFVPGENQVPYLAHAVNPLLAGYSYEVPDLADGA